MNPIEMLAAAFGLVNIVLVARRSIWNYPFALAMVALYAIIFFDAKLYSDVLLQLFFFAINIYGWLVWLRSKADRGEVVAIGMTGTARIGWAIGGAFAIAGWGWLMARYTDAALPWWDGAIAITSIVAQILLSRRYWENWILWIAVDAVAMGVYWVKDLHITVGLYALFLAMSVWGLVAWRRSMTSGIAA